MEGAGALEEIIGVDAEVSEPHHESFRRRRRLRAGETPAQRAPSAAGASKTPSEDYNVERGGTHTARAMVQQPEGPVTTDGGKTSPTPRVNAPAVPLVTNASGRSALNANETSERTPHYSAHVYRKMSTTRALRDAGTAMTTPYGALLATRQYRSPRKRSHRLSEAGIPPRKIGMRYSTGQARERLATWATRVRAKWCSREKTTRMEGQSTPLNGKAARRICRWTRRGERVGSETQ